MSLLELPVLPIGLRQVDGPLPLSVSFRSSGEIDHRETASRHAAMPAMPSAKDPLARVTMHVSLAMAKRRGEKTVGQEHGGIRSSYPGEEAESLASPPADAEREYRLNLAREARRSQYYYPAALTARGQEGIVRMSISYWSRLGKPMVTLEQSSGHRELDQEAMTTMTRAIGSIPLPTGLQGLNFRMQYALEYRLAD